MGRDVDAVARDIIGGAGHAEHFGHGLGHGVGVEVHESPRLNTQSETVLEPGMVVTVEPGIYLPGQGGVRIEDLVVVTDTGCEVLTKSNKELRVIGL
jgi:Xaa-Pro aminopeptidase